MLYLHSAQYKEATTLILLLHHIILRTPTVMHHLGSALSCICFMKRDYEGKSEPNISPWQKYSAHTKVYIFLLKKQLLIIKAFCLRVLCFDKERGSIHHYEWRDTVWIFTVLYLSIFSHSQRCWIFGDLWFMIYDSLALENKPVLHV